MSIDVATVAATAGVTALINVTVWLALKKPIEDNAMELREIKTRVRDQHERRLTALELAEKRFVTQASCQAEHAKMTVELSKGSQRMYDTALRLEQVSSETKRALEWARDMNAQLISAKEDLDRMIGQLHSMRQP